MVATSSDVQAPDRRADEDSMRLAKYAWWLPPLFALGGFILIGTAAFCTYPVGYYGYDVLKRCTVGFLGLDLSQNAAGWLAAGIGGVLGTGLALILTGETARWTWLGVRRWIARAALVIVGLTLLVVGGIAAVSRFDRDVPPASQGRAEKTWILQPGQTLRVPAEDALEEDIWECRGKGGRSFTQPPGSAIINGGLTLEVDSGGNVTAHCKR